MRSRMISGRLARPLIALVVIAGFSALPLPANAQTGGNGLDCEAEILQSTGMLECEIAGGGTGGTGEAPFRGDDGWFTFTHYLDRPCTLTTDDGRVMNSHRGDMWLESDTDQRRYNVCLRPWDPIGAAIPSAIQLRLEAQQLVPQPTLSADYQGNFLTGAEITFTSGAPEVLEAPLPALPDYKLRAVPSNHVWHFGDGTTSTEAKPTHIYDSTSPNPSNPDDHVVHVQLEQTWRLYFDQPTADPGGTPLVEDLGELTLTGTLDRPIVQVWSAQMEPN